MVNRELVRMVGYEQDELLGQAVEMLVPARWSATHPNLRVGFLAHATARRMGSGQALFARRKDGTEVPVDIGLTPMPTAEGGTNGEVLIGEDRVHRRAVGTTGSETLADRAQGMARTL